MATYNCNRKQSKQRLQNIYLNEGVCTKMLANVFVNGLLYGSMQQVMNSTFPTYNQPDYVVKSDIIAVAVIGIIVIGGAAFVLMCRYK
jgi:hypothetical protein